MIPLVKGYLIDFSHSEGYMVHTDLKLDNIMVTFEDELVNEEFVQGQMQFLMARKVALRKIYPKITDFVLVERVDKPGPHIHLIQPNDCHAPEVLFGTGWSSSAEIWNFGIVIWDFLAGQELFQKGDPRSYSPVAHVAEMIALLGPPPWTLIQRERDMCRWQWNPKVRNARGELCSNAAEFYDGPFFTDAGEFVRDDLIFRNRSLESEIPDCIPDEEAERFLKLIRRMLHWLLEERATAKDPKNDPWFDDDVAT